MTKEELQAMNIAKNDDSTVTITGEIPFSYLEKHRVAAVKHLGKDVSIDGFRKGNIPEKVLTEKISEVSLLNEMAERALSAAYPKMIKEHELDAIGYPQINITKIAHGNPLGFTATIAVMPKITLPDYMAIAKEKNLSRESDEVTDEEVEEQIKDIIRQKAAYERLQQKAEEKKDDGADTVTELPTPESVAKEAEENEDAQLPDLTDELVKTLGQPGQFENVDDFKTKIREHLGVQKKQDNASKHRALLTDAIIEQTVLILPQVMIDAEINQMFAQMEEDLKRAGLTMENYLEHIKKTREDLKTEWTPAAEKRAKLQLALNEIAEKETIEPDKSEVDHEVKHLLEHYKDANESRVRTYVSSMLKNEKVMQMLEAQ